MIAQLRAELLKQRSTRTVHGLFATMLSLVLLAVFLHGFGLSVEDLGSPDVQLMVFGRGEFLGVLFAALLGAMSVTAEIRHGTIRSTFLVTPRRRRVVGAKVLASALIGTGFGLIAGASAAAAGVASLRARGIEVQLDGDDYVLLVLGSAVAAGLWAAVGVGVGALIRNQVPVLIGICAWQLFVEGLLAADFGGLGDVGRFLPGAAAAAISGQDPESLLAPANGIVLLAAYAAAAILAGSVSISRRDVG